MLSDQEPTAAQPSQPAQRQNFAKGPRSLSLTFAETHPWEMLVRDRLAALPRGYLKRFLLSLIENCGFDLSSEEVFLQQVERLLLTKNLALTLAHPTKEEGVRAKTGEPGILNRFRQIEQVESQQIAQIAKIKVDSGETPPVSKKKESGSDLGFGALEL